jgi:hypothetical protein
LLALVLGAAQQPVPPSPSSSPAPSLSDTASWIAGHLPSSYDENLAGTTNTITARYSAKACAITVTLDYSTQFNNLRGSDRSAAFSLRGNSLKGSAFNGSEDGGTIDFSIVNPSSLRISDRNEYLGTVEVSADSFEFTFRNESDAKAMLDAMTSFTQACASHKT